MPGQPASDGPDRIESLHWLRLGRRCPRGLWVVLAALIPACISCAQGATSPSPTVTAPPSSHLGLQVGSAEGSGRPTWQVTPRVPPGAATRDRLHRPPPTYFVQTYSIRRGEETKLRSTENGRTAGTVVSRARQRYSLMRAADGSIWTVTYQAEGCRSTVRRTDRAGHTRTVLVLHEAIADPTLSPHGGRLAYVADTQACALEDSGFGSPNPTVLTVLDLRNSRSVSSTAPARIGKGEAVDTVLSSLSWSPNGTHLVVSTGPTASNPIEILSSQRPRFASARTIYGPHGCGLSQSAWTQRGIFATSVCGGRRGIHQSQFVLIGLRGRVKTAMLIRHCTSLTVGTDALHHHVLVDQSTVCGARSGTGTVETLTKGRLRSIGELSVDELAPTEW
jgi:hypothetical protein